MRRHGRRTRSPHLEVRYLNSPSGRARAGVIVPRYSHTAVRRNAVKRRLREALRLFVLPHLDAVDVVVRALPAAYDAPGEELRRECAELGVRLGSRA